MRLSRPMPPDMTRTCSWIPVPEPILRALWSHFPVCHWRCEVVTPKSDSILPSITRRSLVYVAEHYLGLKVTQRPVKLSELDEFAECGLCGTAAVISPVGRIVDHGKEICFPSGMDAMGPVTKKLYDTLTGIQMGTIEAPEGWIRKIV